MQLKWGNRGKTKPNKQECTCETMYMVEISSMWTQHRGTKATKGEKGYFITAAGPPSHWSLSLHLHSFPTSTHVVPMSSRHTRRQNSIFLTGLMLCRQVEHTWTHRSFRKAGQLLIPVESCQHGCCNPHPHRGGTVGMEAVQETERWYSQHSSSTNCR